MGIARINLIVNLPLPLLANRGDLFFGNWTDFVLYRRLKAAVNVPLISLFITKYSISQGNESQYRESLASRANDAPGVYPSCIRVSRLRETFNSSQSLRIPLAFLENGPGRLKD